MRGKRELPLGQVYGLLEPGPVVLVTTARKGKTNIMPMSWHTMMEFDPPLVGCMISNRNHTFEMLRATGECAINIPTAGLVKQVVACGNASGRQVQEVWPHAGARVGHRGPAHRRVLRQPGMQGGGSEARHPIQLFYPGGCQSLDRPAPETSADAPSPGRGRVRGSWQHDQPAFTEDISSYKVRPFRQTARRAIPAVVW